MIQPRIVSNSSPLIALDRIGRLDILERLFSSILIPPAVIREVGPMLGALPWVREHSLERPIEARILRAGLGPGESEAISLALDISASRVLLDDEPARRLAQSLGLPILGTLGVLLASKRRGLLPAVRPVADALLKADFRIAPDLYERVLNEAGEG